jgi:hypothetical protein
VTMSKAESLTELATKAGDELQIHYIELSSLADKFIENNSKLHSMSDLQESVDRYSFRDPIAFDMTLNGGEGGIIEGNGRLEYLLYAKGAKQPAPRGIRDVGGKWYVPVVFGVNAESEGDAIAYSISHNLSAMWGSNLSFLDQSRLFSEDLLKVQLTGLAENDGVFPVGLDGSDFSLWMGLNSELEGLSIEDEGNMNDVDQEDKKKFGVLIPCIDAQHQDEVYEFIVQQGYECKLLSK